MKLYQDLITNFWEHNDYENAIFFFQGFNELFYEALAESNCEHFCAYSGKGYIDYRAINDQQLLPAFIMTRGVKWGFYEEFTSLTKILNDLSFYSGEIVIVKNNMFDEKFPIDVQDDLKLMMSVYDDESLCTDYKCLEFYSDLELVDGVPFFTYVNRHFEQDTKRDIHVCNFFIPSKSLGNQFSPQEVYTKDFALLIRALLLGELKDASYTIKADNSATITEETLSVINSFAAASGVHFEIVDASFLVAEKDLDRHLDVLKQYWGDGAQFRYNRFYVDPITSNETIEISQGQLVNDIIEQCDMALQEDNNYSDMVITAPTGAGKSLLFQIPGIYLEKKHGAVTIVVCPLVALMNDQVEEIKGRGVSFATFINSEITYEERQSRIDGIINGKYSLVYLSPELLLSGDISNIIGERRIGLLVVDEAHLVTSWGRDFRVDYWFLGDYLEKLRRSSYMRKFEGAKKFPVLCLTATAVYGGRDDIVGDLQSSLRLHCFDGHVYIGYVKRDNIEFHIRHPEKKTKSDKEEKVMLTANALETFVKSDNKTIAYFPYISQIDDVFNRLKTNPATLARVQRYNSGMHSVDKNESYVRFKDSSASVMLATKAFGMGVNISDVQTVYHYAPTGTLSDYVQEIGRAARKLEQGYAVTDYLSSDMHYARTLWGLSGLRHYQIKEIIKKLHSLYLTKKSRNLLFSPETFSYLFDLNSIDMKVKSGLMLLSSDLLEKYHFRVLAVRAKNMFTSQFIVVPKPIESAFLSKFGAYCTLMRDNKPRVIPTNNSRNGNILVQTIGDVYEINLAALWEKEFSETTFAQFKFKFFKGELFKLPENVVPKMKLVITYPDSYDTANESMQQLSGAIQKTFLSLSRTFGGKVFKFDDFYKTLKEFYSGELKREYARMLLDIFCYDSTDIFEIPAEQWKFVNRIKESNGTLASDINYQIRTQKFAYIETNLKKNMFRVAPNSDDGKQYITYLTIPKTNEKYSEEQLAASILQLFGFASYELIGGRNAQIFVRINDPLKLQRIAEDDREYKNNLLTAIENRHKRAVKIMNGFMSLNADSVSRWNIIEQYFLGNDDVIDAYLGISDTEVKKAPSKTKKKNSVSQNLTITGEHFKDSYDDWQEAEALLDTSDFQKANIPVPDYYACEVKLDDMSLDCVLVWESAQVAIVTENISKTVAEAYTKQSWVIMEIDDIDFEILSDTIKGD